MSYLQLLNDTYNNLSKVDEKDCERVSELLPIAHSTQKAHLTVTVDIDGNYVRADFVTDEAEKEKNLSETLIPVTEKSAGRTSGSSPHPLCDELKYLAGDYNDYNIIKSDKDKNDVYYNDYLTQLKEWVDSEYSTPKVRAIYTYIKKGSLIEDLIKNNIFSLDSNGYLTEKWENSNIKLTTGTQNEAFVRFSVIGDTAKVNVWDDKYLQEQYIKYYINFLEKNNKKDFCCICGEEKICSENHPKKIRHSGDKAKLISANDTSGFTFRGRFKNADEAVTISYEVSQKVHNALKYLIKNQGEKISTDNVFLLWGTYGEDTPKLNEDSCDFADDFFGDDTSVYSDTKEVSAERFNKAIKGYKTKVDDSTEYAIIGLNSATKGRISVVYYREYHGKKQINDLLNNIELWHKTSAWYHSYKFKDKNKIEFYGAPSPYDISTFAFGKEEGNIVKGDEKTVGKSTERLLRSITDAAKIPRDIVNILVRKCFSPQNYSENNWNKLLSITCSVYKKYLFDYKGESVDMSIDNGNKDISYNCGRLLAVADAIEKYAQYDKDGKSGARTTNAMRFFTRFCNYPCSTWKKIHENLKPYIISLGAKGIYLNNLLAEISSNIDADEFNKAKNLDGRVALGFDAQRFEINEHIYNKNNQEEK